MTKQQKALECIARLKQKYPDAMCTLETTDPYWLLVSVRLAAQCTDARVNQIVPLLFEKYPDIPAMAAADVADVTAIVRPCGLGNSKARDIVACAKMLKEEFNCRVPDTMEQLLRLPGVGRKSANLILGDVYGKPAIVTDTHCIRITNKLGLATGKEPYKVEKQLWEIIPPQEGNNFCHRLVLFGREVCTARSPKCDICPLADICDSAPKKEV